MRVKILTPLASAAGSFSEGEEIELIEALALDYIRCGFAESLEDNAAVLKRDQYETTSKKGRK